MGSLSAPDLESKDFLLGVQLQAFQVKTLLYEVS